MSRKRLIITLSAAAVIVAAVSLVWTRWFSPTRIAFVNYQVTELGQIAKANGNPFVKIRELPVSRIDEAGRYDMVFVNGMGIRITEEQRASLEKAAGKGLPVLVTAATNPANDIVSTDSLSTVCLKQYLAAAGRANYRNMLSYVRKHIDGKIFKAPAPEQAVEREYHLLYHSDPENPDNEDRGFDSVSEYERFLKEHGLYRADAPAIILTGQMGEPSELVRSLEADGKTVYPVRYAKTFFMEGHADSIDASAVINMAHGRMGDYMVEYLDKRNIPLFAPLNINRIVEDWENDPMGMSGGFMSQSIVTPEIDGAERPYVLFGNYVDKKDGLQYLKAIPERLGHFVRTVDNYISLKEKPEKEKKIAIYYLKGPGQSALTAGGMDVVPSLYNLLVRLRDEGYDVSGLPGSAEELGRMIQQYGPVFGSYAEEAMERFIRDGNPELVSAGEYESWAMDALGEDMYRETTAANGEFPGPYMATSDGRLALARLRFGNIVLLPQLPAGSGDNDFEMVHGTDAAPPHSYIASYLWVQYGFKADALIHFGTHGSLEFTPSKQVALSRRDWSDRLVGDLPHFYVYTISNVGEAMMAKRRAYAGIVSYLTPPFIESGVRDEYAELTGRIRKYNDLLGSESVDGDALDKASRSVKESVLSLGINRELGLDTIPDTCYSEEEIARVESFAEELVNEKISGPLYVLGEPYGDKYIRSTVTAMCTDPVAYGLYAVDKAKGRADVGIEKHKSQFTAKYIVPAKRIVSTILDRNIVPDDGYICRIAGITAKELAMAREMSAASNRTTDMISATTAAGAISEVERTLQNVMSYRETLEHSPENELESIINGLDGGYIVPSPGGDPVANPNTLPTGRNLFAINAEATPSKEAWEKGRKLADKTIDLYRQRHNDSIPRKVSYTLWSSEFIETEGATIAQILHMLGTEPVWDAFGRVTDLRLVPSEELGRPRIDVVVQTSGQLRDIAASRLFLISRAVEMAAASTDDIYGNMVASNAVETERKLIDKGLTPKDAREISMYRVFGGVGGNYGTGIQSMVQSGDSWDDDSQIAEAYIRNMGAYYGSEDKWEEVRQFAFEAALDRTDAVIQPRQSNTWGALSLDHVYEFMGGMNLAVRNVTGKDPDAYLSDYRNRNNIRMQELKEAIGVESRTTLFNPVYIREKMKGGAADASVMAEMVKNTYGWDVMKPEAIDDGMWDRIYDVYIKDSYGLGVDVFFKEENPAALQEMTAIMMESARKGLWKASEAQLAVISSLHSELETRQAGESAAAGNGNGVVMKKEQLSSVSSGKNIINGTITGAVAVAMVVFLIIFVRKRRRNTEKRN